MLVTLTAHDRVPTSPLKNDYYIGSDPLRKSRNIPLKNKDSVTLMPDVNDLEIMMRSRVPLIIIETHEEPR
ncbi:MAG: hypothetical protein WBA20_16550, partial [Ketobacter sp.]